MKAYKDSKGKVRLFRPDMNMKRMNNSMTRLAMPELDQEGFLECMRQLIKMDASWVPDKDGYSLYIRPTAIGTSAILGVHASADVKLFTILSPVGPYYKSGIVPVRLLADSMNVRAWPGGVGHVKVIYAMVLPIKIMIHRLVVTMRQRLMLVAARRSRDTSRCSGCMDRTTKSLKWEP